MPPLSRKDGELYGIAKKPKLKGAEISSSNSLAFTSQLSSLIANSSASKDRLTTGRARGRKDDIFSAHNKGTKKRAIKDIDDTEFAQKHSTSGPEVDEAIWHRSKRKMEEKARLYAAMKRGDVEDEDERYAVDFDRKWAEAQEQGADGAEEHDTSEGEDDADSEEELIEYVDEFGRTRQGTRAQAAREERRRKTAALADEPDRFAARPKMPTNVIYGATIQSAAFNPDEPAAAQMAELAANRDKEPTPPPDEHFDGRKEIRTKGVGFFHFSGDAETRKTQMEQLAKERAETEQRRAELEKRKEDRKKELEARKRALADKRSKLQADQFLESLAGEMSSAPVEKSNTGPPRESES